MRQRRQRICFACVALLSVANVAIAETKHTPLEGSSIRMQDGFFVPYNETEASSDVRLVQLVEPTQPIAPVQPLQPLQPLMMEDASAFGQDAFGGFVDMSLLSPERQQAASVAGASDVILGSESQVRNTTDSNDLLVSSLSSTGVFLHSRNPISNDPRIRGFHFSQIRGHVNGAYYYAARADFDTPLSRIDSSLIRDVIVIKGPYTVRQGPGFSFIDIQLEETPRYAECNNWGGRTATAYDSNGQAWNARQTFWGGGCNYGFRIGYGHRTAVDYRSGNGRRVAGGYNSRDWDAALGFDLRENESLEINYQRTDQTDVELPAQYFDVRVLESDAFTGNYTVVDQCYYDQLKFTGWFNRTAFQGDPSPGPGGGNNNGNFGEVRSSGLRTTFSWGEIGCRQLAVGVDLSLVDQASAETAPAFFGDYGIPRSVQSDAGIFADATLPVACRHEFTAGGRLDWIRTDVKPSTLNIQGGSPYQNSLQGDQLRQHYNLGAGFLAWNYELTPEMDFNASVGYAERQPSPTDLYARTYLDLLQPGGLTDFRGSLLSAANNFAALKKEKLIQGDIGVNFNFEDAHGGAHFFYSEIDDFVTYHRPGATVQTISTDARILGGEAYGEMEINCWLTALGSIAYVYGEDVIRDEPLWSIPPLESRLGLRITQPCPQPTWGAEFTARIVDTQQRVAFLGNNTPVERPTAGFAVFDVRTYYHINRRVMLIGGVENLTDKHYQDHFDSQVDLNYQTPAGVFRPGVNGYIGVVSNY